MAIAARAGFVRENYLIGAELEAATEAIAGFEIANVVNSLHYERWRSTTFPDSFTFDLGAQKSIQVLVIRFQSGRDPSETFIPAITGSDTVTLKLSNVGVSGSELLDVDITPVVDETLGYLVYFLENAITAQYGSLEFDIPSRDPEPGFFEVEEVWLGTIWQPAQNYQENADDNEDDKSLTDISDNSGATFSQARARRESYERGWQVTTHSEYEAWRAFRRSHGIVKRFVYLNRTDTNKETNCIIARFGTPVITRRLLEGQHYFVRATIIENR